MFFLPFKNSDWNSNSNGSNTCIREALYLTYTIKFCLKYPELPYFSMEFEKTVFPNICSLQRPCIWVYHTVLNWWMTGLRPGSILKIVRTDAPSLKLEWFRVEKCYNFPTKGGTIDKSILTLGIRLGSTSFI